MERFRVHQYHHDDYGFTSISVCLERSFAFEYKKSPLWEFGANSIYWVENGVPVADPQRLVRYPGLYD